ncbi:MAG TPA: hypothetical protein VFZ61_33160 [Polyangiales bacterium]
MPLGASDFEDHEVRYETSSRLAGLALASIEPARAAMCRLFTDRKLGCDGSPAMVSDWSGNPWSVTSNLPIAFQDIAGTHDHFCGTLLDEPRRVACWGLNDLGQLGVSGAPATAVYVQREAGGELSGVTSVAVGQFKACATLQSGHAFCWGDNSSGALGHGDTAQHVGAVQVVGVTDAVQVAVAASHACARTRSGEVYCWGRAAYLGIGDAKGDAADGSIFTSAQQVAGLHGVVELQAAGTGHHTCAQLETGPVLCWGGNHAGQLGDGTLIDRAQPTAVSGLFEAWSRDE